MSEIEPGGAAWPSADLRLGLTDAACRAIAGLLPSMVCGEESAVVVFSNESRRAPEDLFADSREALARIAEEESGHERVLRSLASALPEPTNEAAVRRLARRFFHGLHTDDIGEHFSRIAWLDAGVCAIFASLQRSPSLASAAPLRGVIRRILREEGSHVAFSRAYSRRYGVSDRVDRESFLRVRGGLVALLEPCADSLEALEVDPGLLFASLRRRSLDRETP